MTVSGVLAAMGTRELRTTLRAVVERVEQGIERAFAELQGAPGAFVHLPAQAIAVERSLLKRVQHDQRGHALLQLMQRRAHTSDNDVSWPPQRGVARGNWRLRLQRARIPNCRGLRHVSGRSRAGGQIRQPAGLQ